MELNSEEKEDKNTEKKNMPVKKTSDFIKMKLDKLMQNFVSKIS